jgi:hypothetical protein
MKNMKIEAQMKPIKSARQLLHPTTGTYSAAPSVSRKRSRLLMALWQTI